MPTLPAELLNLIVVFEPLFSKSVWAKTGVAGEVLIFIRFLVLKLPLKQKAKSSANAKSV
jgi:hypothetical protein